MHHNIERVSADGQREPALDDMRREQAGNPQIERNRQRRARIHAECAAAEIRAVGEQIREALVPGGEQHAQHHEAEQIRHGGQAVALFQHAAIELTARKPRQENHRAQQPEGEGGLPPRKAELHRRAAGNQAEQEGHHLIFVPQPGQPPDQRVGGLRAEERKDEPRAEVPDEVLAVRDRREQQGVGRKRRAQLKPAETAQKRRAHAVNGIPEIQRHEQLFRPVRQIRACAAVQFEEVAGAESEHHQVEGVIAKQAVHLEQMAVCRVSIHHKDDGEQIKHTHCMVFRFVLHR